MYIPYLVLAKAHTYLPKDYFDIDFPMKWQHFLICFCGYEAFVMYCVCPVHFILSSQGFELVQES